MSTNSRPFSKLPSGYEIVDHTADWALRVQGEDLEELFANAAAGMAALLVENPDDIARNESREIELAAADPETLLVDWLSELAYWAEQESLVFVDFNLLFSSDTHLEAKVSGGEVKELQKHIKAVTFHNLEIVETERGLEVTVVFDV